MKRILLALILLTTLVGCASSVNRRNMERYAQAGYTALKQSDWLVAKESFHRASVNARLGKAPPRTESVLTYEYGRAAGVTCDYENSQAALQHALKLDEASSGPVHYSLIELARLNLAFENFGESAAYFERALPEIEKLGLKSRDPLGYARLLEQYASALDSDDQAAKAKSLQDEAKVIRSRNLDGEELTDVTPYRTKCTKG